MFINKVKETIADISKVTETLTDINKVKETITDVQENIKQTTEMAKAVTTQVTKEVQKEAKPWIKLGNKAVDGGVKMLNKQQAIAVDAIEEVKGQLKESNKRFKKIMSL